MARTEPNKNTDVTLTEEEIAAQAVKEAEAAEAAEAAAADDTGTDDDVEVVRVRAKFNRMRNPYTSAVFTTQKVTDVIDLQSKENCWTRDQIAANVLEIVK